MLVCGKSISQTVTQKKSYPLQTQENKVAIDIIIARLIANDLVSGDVCKEEIKLVRSNLDLTKKEVVLKDSIINTLGKQKEALNLIISKKDEMFIKQEEISNTYKKELSKQKRTTFLYKFLSVLGLLSTTYFIIK
jgi:type II restriction/modification system DNA methylase subunit YeeA